MNTDRLNAFQSITKEEAIMLFSYFNSKFAVLNCSPIHVGMSNSNYIITTAERKYLLRLYANSTDVVETGTYLYLQDKVNVPALLYYDGSKRSFPYAYAVLEYIDGITLHDTVKINNGFSREIIYEIGKMCAVVHGKKYEYDALLKQDMTVHEQIPKTSERIFILLNGKAGTRLNRETRDKLFAFIDSNTSIFDRMEDESVLCHGDFSFSNILVANGKAYFIDFEFAYAGSRYHDIGHFFRRKSDAIQSCIDNKVYSAFAEGYSSTAPSSLPKDWLVLARLCDIPPMLCLINRDEVPDEWVADIEYDILCSIDRERILSI